MKKLATILLLWLFILNAWAVKVRNLYQAEITVPDQTDAERAQAVTKGFLSVLTKITGSPQVQTDPMIESNLSKADYYVQDFSYSSSKSASEYLLTIHYNKVDLLKLVKRAGLSYWEETRPLILVWLSFNDNNQAEIISKDSGKLYRIVKQQGGRFALPLIFPIMDLTDINQVSVADINNVSLDTLREAGRRYAPNAMLIGKLNRTKSGFNSQWMLVYNNKKWNWSIAEKTPQIIFLNLFTEVSQVLARVNNLQAQISDHSILKLQISNIETNEDLEQLLAYLKRITAIKEIELTQVSEREVMLSVQIKGSVSAFLHYATQGQRLLLKSQDPELNRLDYEWIH